MALRDFFRGGRREREDRPRYPLDPLSRESWRNESEARYGAHRDYEDQRRHFNDRWENSYSGAGYGRFSDDYGRFSDEERGGETHYGGTGGNPFYGQRPLMNAGSAYDYGYFGSKSGLPMTPWRPETDNMQMDDLVYGGRSFDADAWSQGRGEFSGRFRGLGPRGYRRSDERIKEDVCQCLTDDEHIDASNIEVAVNDREVMLTGTVTSRMQKRHAEDIVEHLPGVRDVINSLRVESEPQGAQSTTRLGGSYR